MTKPAFRQHDLRRAIAAYVQATGKTPEVRIEDGRVILAEAGEPIPPPKGDDGTCDKVFGL